VTLWLRARKRERGGEGGRGERGREGGRVGEREKEKVYVYIYIYIHTHTHTHTHTHIDRRVPLSFTTVCLRGRSGENARSYRMWFPYIECVITMDIAYFLTWGAAGVLCKPSSASG
jgi:hypothetical protein